MRKKLIILLAGILILTFNLTLWAQEYNESPLLKDRVQEGELPPVEERLPEEPLVLEPLNEIGEYGGNWKRFSNAEEWGFFPQATYGSSPVRWVETKAGYVVEPNFIKSWEVNEDSTTWTLHFRKGVKWSDGELLTTDDFMFWWELAKKERAGQYIPGWAKVEVEVGNIKPMQVKQIDDYTLQFDFGAPAPALLENLACLPTTGAGALFVIPEHYGKNYHPDYSEEYDNYNTLQDQLEWFLPERPTLKEWDVVKQTIGERLTLERNPYYYAVDPEGNQLPYIDKVTIDYITDAEVFKMELANGNSDMQIRPDILNVRDISLCKSKEEECNFETLVYDSGSGGGLLYPNRNFPESEKRKLYQNPKFLRALSHSINRDKINRMVYFDSGEPTSGIPGPKNPVFHRTERGQKLFKEWRNLAIEYNPEKAKSMLDEIGVVDSNGDGWRELPSGEELTLRIDIDAEVGDRIVDRTELVKKMWEDVGLNIIINTVSGEKMMTMQTNATFDIRGDWENGGIPMLDLWPDWFVPIRNITWAPLYGSWYNTQGTEQAGTELDQAPRDRTPPRQQPPEGSPVAEIQSLYNKFKSAATQEKRDELWLDIVDIHIEEGPILIGLIANYPRVGVVSDRMKNVPRREDLPLGGWVNPWIMSYIGQLNTSTFYIEE